MAKSPEKKSPAAKDDGYRKRGNPLTDYLDASEPLHPGGFGEPPQAEFSGTPLTGSVSDWADADRARGGHVRRPAVGASGPRSRRG